MLFFWALTAFCFLHADEVELESLKGKNGENLYRINRAHFLVSYPQTWQLNKQEAQFEIDSYFTIDCPQNSFATFHFYNEEKRDLSQTIENILRPLHPAIQDYTQTPFKRWGNYSGEGVELNGQLMGMYPGKIRIFATNYHGRSFVITEFYYQEDSKLYDPGVSILQKSFRLK